MTLLQSANIDIEITKFKRELDKAGLRKELKLRAIPKKSERIREKARLARMKRRKRERMPEGRDFGNEKAPWFKFVWEDGICHKVIVRAQKRNETS